MTLETDYIALNATLAIPKDGKIQFDKDKEAVKAYFIEHVNQNTIFFHDLKEKLDYLVENDYYSKEVLDLYSWTEIKNLFKKAYAYKYRFKTYMGAVKFYTGYALKNRDSGKYLERYEDRVVMYALESAGGNYDEAKLLLEEVITGRFQPATPTFLNSGKKNAGEKVSCFLIQTGDSRKGILKTIAAALELSAMGGGVGISLSNLREAGAPIRGIKGAASGLLGVMKILEDTFSYADQLGQRQGAGAVFVHAHHPDIMKVIDSKRENADEKIRIKTLSLGIVVPDITFELAKNNEDMYLFSPYDIKRVYGKDLTDFSVTEHYYEMVDNPEITKTKISARGFFTAMAEVQTESGYPYILFEDNTNRQHNLMGWISQSNICVEIVQLQKPSTYNEDGSYKEVGRDISCNLGSINIAYAMDGRNLPNTIERGIRALSAVSDQSNIVAVPTVQNGNRHSHSIGLGQMNLHGFLGREHIYYGSEESIDFVNMYFYATAYYAVLTSNMIATERNEKFDGFETSKYATGEAFAKYLVEDHWVPKTDRVKELLTKYNFYVPTADDWRRLSEAVIRNGMYNAYIQAVPPTGSISYINNATASIQPITFKVEPRKEGKLGQVYYPAPEMTMENLDYFETAYNIGWKKLIDVTAAAQKHVDQSISMTLYFKSGATTRDINKAQIYARSKNIKTIYYVRIYKEDKLGNSNAVESCESCVL